MRPSILLVCAALIATALPVLAQIKQWTDENGVVHYGNEPQTNAPAPSRVIKVRKSYPFTASAADLRRTGEAYLTELGRDLNSAQLQLEILKLDFETMAIGQNQSGRLSVSLQRNSTIMEATIKLYTPIRADLLSFEKVVKEFNAGVLPQWVKDNRDWRALDAEFAPKK